MGDYISTKRPSLLARFLGFLGIIMVPIKVNCWYCNQDSYLLPGGNQMERNWYCHFCENTNLRDESGDIVDPPPVINEGRISTITPMRDTSQTFQKATLCDNCQQNQMIIYILMSDYIKDEKDPNYEYYVKTADQHKAELHKKYPLCDNCQAKVDEFAASQKEALRLQRFRQKLARSSSTKTPIKPSTFAYTLRGTVWVLLHLSTVCFILYASIYPPLQPSLAEVLEEFKKLWDVCIAGVSSFATYQQIGLSPVIIRHVLDNTRDTCWYLTTTYLRTMKQSTMCLYGYNIGIHDNETCGWSLARYIVPLTIMAVCSFIWMDWHPFVSKTYFEEDRIQRWKLYKAIQRFFYLLRFGILLLLATSDQDKIHYILKPILFGYPIILISSFFVVKIPYSSRPARKVGNAVTLTGIKRTFSQIQLLAADTFEKVSEEALNAARYNRKPKESSSTSFDEQFMQTDSESASPAPPTPATPQRVGSMDTMAFSVKSDIIGGGMHQGGQSMLSARDDDLDTIVAGVHRIKFNGSL